MPNIFKRKKIEKESNVAKSPEHKPKSKKLSGKRALFVIWNIFSIAIYSCYTFFVTYRLSKHTFLGKAIVVLLIIYAITFLFLLIFSINSKKLKYRLKNYKSATNFLKYFVQIINFALSIVTAISAFITTGTTDISAISYAVLSLVITFFMILFEIAKIIVRKNIPLIKRNFLEMRDDDYANNKEKSK